MAAISEDDAEASPRATGAPGGDGSFALSLAASALQRLARADGRDHTDGQLELAADGFHLASKECLRLARAWRKRAKTGERGKRGREAWAGVTTAPVDEVVKVRPARDPDTAPYELARLRPGRRARWEAATDGALLKPAEWSPA